MSMLSSACLDGYCKFPIVFPEGAVHVSCRACGQTHLVANLIETTPLVDLPTKVETVLRSLLVETQTPKRGPETVKVLGVSNYHHKLISHLLSYYGMDKVTGKAKLLKDLIKRTTLDCAVFADRSFSIEKSHLNIVGYGRDESGSASYLAGTLDLLLPYNDNKHLLVPLHVDGDGHCLVHAVSRGLLGRQMFWHPLRVDLKRHFSENLEVYKMILGDFINGSEWRGIIAECDADFVPADGFVGLRPIHLFGLANILLRPIILLDSVAGMNTSADYAAVFIPGLSAPEKCRNNAGQPNPPLCLAWSSPARNHYIPLVPIKDSPLPQIPKHLLPKVWGLPQNMIEHYIHFNENNCVVIGGENCIQPAYMLRLTSAMDDLFHTKYGAPVNLVEEVYIYQYARKGGGKMSSVIEATSSALQDRRLQRCLVCDAVNILPLSEDWLRPRGFLYTLAKKQYGFLREDRKYPFSEYGVTCKYNARKDMLVVDSAESMNTCTFCSGQLRMIHNDGTVAYENGDRTNIPVKNASTNQCPCGFKHWWKGVAYDNPPHEIPVVLNWNGVVVTDEVQWFQYESDKHLNSNAYQIASYLLQKHFPGEFGSESLHQCIVQQIMDRVKELPPVTTPMETASAPTEKEEACGGSPTSVVSEPMPSRSSGSKITPDSSAGPSHFKHEQTEPAQPCLKRTSVAASRGGSVAACRGSYRVGPGMSMLSSTPVTHDSQAMDRFMQLMKRKTPPSESESSPHPPSDDPSPSTSKQ